MVVFISWSGPRAKKLAAGLSDWLRAVIQSLRPFMSETDIGAGTVWSDEIHDRLKSSGFGIVCVTHENMESPWLNYEAGGLANAVTRPRVCPYVLRMKTGEVRGPLSRFQGKVADKDGTLELLRSINAVLQNENQLADKTLDMMFAKFWPDLEALINSIGETAAAPKPRPDSDKIDEMLSLVRDLARQPAPITTFSYADWVTQNRGLGIESDALKNVLFSSPTYRRAKKANLRSANALGSAKERFAKGTQVLYRGITGTVRGRAEDATDSAYVLELEGGKDVIAAATEIEAIADSGNPR